MVARRFNWPLWAGFVLAVAAFLTYFLVFVWLPVTRDFPWANLLLFVLATAFLLVGVRRGFAASRPHPTRSKIVTSVVATLGLAVFGLFVFMFFVFARWLPASTGAPRASQQAPDFTLTDTNGNQVSLNELLAAPLNGNPPRGVLLVFYRGHW